LSATTTEIISIIIVNGIFDVEFREDFPTELTLYYGNSIREDKYV